MPGRIYSVAFAPDGSKFVAGSSIDGTGEVRVYQTADAKQVTKLEGQPGAVYAVTWRPDGAQVAVGGVRRHGSPDGPGDGQGFQGVRGGAVDEAVTCCLAASALIVPDSSSARGTLAAKRGPSMRSCAAFILVVLAAHAAAAPPVIDLNAGRRFWSFQPPRSHPGPAVKDAAWPRGDIDRFVLAKLEKKGIRPVADADAQTLVRRLYYDLIGLPPTPEQSRRLCKSRGSEAASGGGGPRRSVARQPALRRALGAALARRRPLCRLHRRRSVHDLQGRLALPRLRHRVVQRRPALRPVRPRADRRRPVARSATPDAAPPAAGRHRVPRPRPDQLRGAGQGRARNGRDRRADRHAGPRLPRYDDRLRPLPRPQVRSDPDARLLRPRRHPEEHAHADSRQRLEVGREAAADEREAGAGG